MKRALERPISCLITPGRVTDEAYAAEAGSVERIAAAAVRCGVSVIQLREKTLSARALTELAASLVRIARGTDTLVFVNDRADVAAAADCDGVHLTSRSLPLGVIAGAFPDLLIGVSAHSLADVKAAAAGGADLAIFGPVFATPGKGKPVGLEQLAAASLAAGSMPVVAVGGIDAGNVISVLDAGASGFAAIRAMENERDLSKILGIV